MDLFRLKFLDTSVTLWGPSRAEPSRLEVKVCPCIIVISQAGFDLAQHDRNIRHSENFLIT